MQGIYIYRDPQAINSMDLFHQQFQGRINIWHRLDLQGIYIYKYPAWKSKLTISSMDLLEKTTIFVGFLKNQHVQVVDYLALMVLTLTYMV